MYIKELSFIHLFIIISCVNSLNVSMSRELQYFGTETADYATQIYNTYPTFVKYLYSIVSLLFLLFSVVAGRSSTYLVVTMVLKAHCC